MTISNNLFINKAKTCAVTGHRVLNQNFDSEGLTLTLKKVIKAGFDTFLVGMAIGFDTELIKNKKKSMIFYFPKPTKRY